MTEIYLRYGKTPYLFDIRQVKLFRLKGGDQIEIKNSETLRRVRLSSTEISRELAMKLALEFRE